MHGRGSGFKLVLLFQPPDKVFLMTLRKERYECTGLGGKLSIMVNHTKTLYLKYLIPIKMRAPLIFVHLACAKIKGSKFARYECAKLKGEEKCH